MMPDKNCFLCGKGIDEHEHDLCPDCRATAEKRNSTDFFVENLQKENSRQDVVNPETEFEKTFDETLPVEKQPEGKSISKKKKTIFGSLLIVLLVAVLAVFVLQDQRKTERGEKAELNFWYSCIEKNTPHIYSQYLLSYPDGRFRNEAHAKIAELRNNEREEWEKLKKSTNIDDFYGFLGTYPETPFRNEINKITDSLSWIAASRENTADSYKLYIENTRSGNIGGYYEGIAKTRYDFLSNIIAIDDEESDKIKNTLDIFFQTLSETDYETLEELMDKNISNFYGARRRNSSVIISSIASDMEKNNIKKLLYNPDFENFKVFKTGNGLYSVEMNVLKNIIYTTKKDPDKITETLYVEVTPELKIKSLYAKK